MSMSRLLLCILQNHCIWANIYPVNEPVYHWIKKENAPNFLALTISINGWSMSFTVHTVYHGLNPGRTYHKVWLWHVGKDLPWLIHFKSLPRASSCYEYNHTLFEADLAFLAQWIQMRANGLTNLLYLLRMHQIYLTFWWNSPIWIANSQHFDV